MTPERVDQRQEVVEFIFELLEGWETPTDTLTLGGMRWLPDLAHSDGRLLHLTLEDIGPPWRKRLAAAKTAGRKLVIACSPNALTLSNLEFIQEIDGSLLLLDLVDEDPQISKYDSVADLVAKRELALGRDGLMGLANPLFDRALASTEAYLKGMLFEQVLCLLFSQVSYFHVLEHRYMNETEEIDLVLGNRATGELAGILGGPIVLVSAKNQAQPVGSPDVRALRGNMTKRRRRCSFGILASARTLAKTASSEQVHVTDDPSQAVALLDGSTIRELIASPQLDRDLQTELIKAVME